MSQNEPPLTLEQVECLGRCARALSIRFESSQTIKALIDGGYVNRGVAGVITVTRKGQECLRKLNYD
jgi:hypothetical protein